MLRWCFFYPTNLIFSTLLLEYPLFKWVICISSDWRSSMISILSAWSEWMPGPPGPQYWTMWLPESPPGTQGRTSLTSGGHFRDELLPEDSSLCLNVLSARLNNLNICFYLVGKGKRILIFLSKIISLAEFFWIWCILWKASFVKYNWFFDIFLMLLFLKKFKVG